MEFFFIFKSFFLKFLISSIIVFLFFTLSFSRSGEDIYKSFCITCHSPQTAKLFQAPAAHSDDWILRKDTHLKLLENVSNKALGGNFDVLEAAIINSLAESAIKGTIKGMPPKGTCMDCTKEDLKSVIIFMISR